MVSQQQIEFCERVCHNASRRGWKLREARLTGGYEWLSPAGFITRTPGFILTQVALHQACKRLCEIVPSMAETDKTAAVQAKENVA